MGPNQQHALASIPSRRRFLAGSFLLGGLAAPVLARGSTAAAEPQSLKPQGVGGAAKNPGSALLFLSVKASGESAPSRFGEDCTMHSAGGMDVSEMLECSEFEAALERPATGHAAWRPARFQLRLGASTPFLFDACRMNKMIELELRVLRRDHSTGEIVHNFTYRIGEGRIVGVRIGQPSVLDAATAALPPYLELSVAPGTTEVTSVTGATSMTDQGATGRRR